MIYNKQKDIEDGKYRKPEQINPVKCQVVGISGGVIEPTEINIELFRNAIEYKKAHIGERVSLAKMNLSKNKYNRAWKHAITTQNETLENNDLIENGRG